MKRVKIFFWLLLVGFLALIIFQNKAFFMAQQTFQLNLGFWHLDPPLRIANVVTFLGFFFAGLLIAYFHGLYGQFRLNRTIRQLNATVAAQSEELEGLRRRTEPERPAREAPPADAGDKPAPDAPTTPPSGADA